LHPFEGRGVELPDERVALLGERALVGQLALVDSRQVVRVDPQERATEIDALF
jgi:hypothetical protein